MSDLVFFWKFFTMELVQKQPKNTCPHMYEYYFSVFKGSIVGKWLEYASTFSNMNIFSSVLTSEKMMEKTSTLAMEDDCVGAGDYLR